MTDASPPAASPDFWRCGKCGTPNPRRSYLTTCLGCGAVRSEAPASGEKKPPKSSTRPVPPKKKIKNKHKKAKTTDTGGPRGGRVGAFLALGFTWAYAVLVLMVLVLIRWVGEGWWGVTLLLFLPRWLFLAPVPVLALASGLARRPAHWAIQGAIALVVAGPLMLISLPVHQLFRHEPEGERFRIFDFNRSDFHNDTARMIALFQRERIDLICFQESSAYDKDLEPFFSKGWYRDQSGYVASRFPIIEDLGPLRDELRSGQRYSARLNRVRVRPPSGRDFWVVSAHLPTLRKGLMRSMEGDVAGLKVHIDHWRHEMRRVVDALAEIADRPFLVGGDFNMPPDDSTMAGLRGACLFGFEEAGWGYGYTRPTNSPWFRIDDILASPDWVFTRCWVGPNLGSDHLPLVAEVVLPAARPPEKTQPRK